MPSPSQLTAVGTFKRPSALSDIDWPAHCTARRTHFTARPSHARFQNHGTARFTCPPAVSKISWPPPLRPPPLRALLHGLYLAAGAGGAPCADASRRDAMRSTAPRQLAPNAPRGRRARRAAAAEGHALRAARGSRRCADVARPASEPARAPARRRAARLHGRRRRARAAAQTAVVPGGSKTPREVGTQFPGPSPRLARLRTSRARSAASLSRVPQFPRVDARFRPCVSASSGARSGRRRRRVHPFRR